MQFRFDVFIWFHFFPFSRFPCHETNVDDALYLFLFYFEPNGGPYVDTRRWTNWQVSGLLGAGWFANSRWLVGLLQHQCLPPDLNRWMHSLLPQRSLSRGLNFVSIGYEIVLIARKCNCTENMLWHFSAWPQRFHSPFAGNAGKC